MGDNSDTDCREKILIMRYVLIFAAALYAVAAAPVWGAIDTIYTIPFTVTTDHVNDTLIVDQDSTSLHAGGRAITFDSGVHDVRLSLSTDSLIWNMADSTGRTGIYINNNNYNIVIDGGYVAEEPSIGQDTSIAINGIGVRLGTAHDITIQNTIFKTMGYNSQAILGDGGYNIDFINCNFLDSVFAFDDRQLWIDYANIAIGACDDTTQSGFNYHARVHACSSWSHWVGLYLQGTHLVATVDSNYFLIDAHNELSGAGFPSTAGQCYNMSFRVGTAVRLNIFGNYLTSGTSYAGGRGIFFAAINGIAADSINVHDNIINVHQGYDGEYTTLNGIIARQGVSNARFYNNTIICVGDTSSGLGDSYGIGPMSGFRLTGSPAMHDVNIVNNDVQVYYTGNWTPNYATDAMNGACIMFDEYNQISPDVVIDSNTFTSNSINVRWGFANGHGGSCTMFNNEYAAIDTSNQDLAYTFYLGYGAGTTQHAYGNLIIDPNLSGASGDTIYCWDGEPDSLSIALAVIFTLTVQDLGSQPVDIAACSVWNDYGNLVAKGNTNASGIFSDTLKYWEEFNDTFSNPDSIAFNDFIFKAIKDGNADQDTLTVDWNSKNLTLTLPTGGGSVPTHGRFLKP